MILRGALASVVALLLIASAASAAPTIVSLQFDDSTTDQQRALPLLASHGMHATFYVNSARLGKTGYLSWGKLRDIQDAGHEIAGHTLTHARLTTLSEADARAQICDDRTRLLAHGLAADDFAYPFGAADATAKRLVQECGYISGRGVSGIVAGSACQGCPWAERIPPYDRWLMRIPDSVRSATPISQVEGYVTQAKAHGGGWIQILMHHVCDACNEYSISQAHLAELLDWLAAEPGIAVKTVAEVLDAAGPTARVAAPAAGSSGTGTVTITAGFDAPAGVRRVRFFADGKQLGTRTSSPWRWKWDTTNATRGAHELRVLVEDRNGNAALAAPITYSLL